MPSLRFKLGFDPRRIVWSPADGKMTPFCSVCQAHVGEVPLMMWRGDGACAQFCDECVQRYITVGGKE